MFYSCRCEDDYELYEVQFESYLIYEVIHTECISVEHK